MTDNDFIRKYSKLVYTLARSRTNQKSDADDVFQEVFLRYIDKAPKFRDEEHARAWLIRVTINVSRCFYRATEFTKRIDMEEEELEQRPSEDNDIADIEDKTAFEENIEKIDEKYRAALLLYFCCGYKIKEVAKILGISERRVRILLENGKREYRNLIMKGDDIDE